MPSAALASTLPKRDQDGFWLDGLAGEGHGTTALTELRKQQLVLLGRGRRGTADVVVDGKKCRVNLELPREQAQRRQTRASSTISWYAIGAMSEPSPFCAEVLKAGARGYAAVAVEKLFAQFPELDRRFAPNASSKWRDNLLARIQYLAASVDTGHHVGFVQHVAWEKIALMARGGDEACRDLECSLRVLRETLAAELPVNASAAALQCLDLTLERFHAMPTDVSMELDTSTPAGTLGAKYLLAVLEGDRRAACELILDAAKGQSAITGTLTVTEICERVLGPVQIELGRMWRLNQISIAEEHFATETTQTAISMLYLHLAQRPRHGKVALCACVESNAHDVGVRMVAAALEDSGWRAICLGQNVPIDDLARAAADFQVDLIALSGSLITHVPLIGAAIARLREAAPNAKIMVGGLAFAGSSLDQQLGADASASSIADVVAVANRLVGLQTP